MKRLLRFLRKTIALASILLLIISALLWFRSYHTAQYVAWNGSSNMIKVSTSDCTFELWWLRAHWDSLDDGWSHASWPNEPPKYPLGRYEIYTSDGFKIALPFWLLTSIGAALVLSNISIRLVTRRAPQPGLCPTCGYDLRATPRPPGDGGEVLAVCPECGHASRPSRPQRQ